jgi:uncharacterized protein (TIGR03084 family)
VATDIELLIADLQDESADLLTMVDTAGPQALTAPTPAEGWTVADTLGHLWFFDVQATQALEDPDGFVAGLEAVFADPAGFLNGHLDDARRLGDSLIPSMRAARTTMIDAIRRTPPSTRVPWYGPPMSPASFTTARLMETWAHGQDIADALAVSRQPTDRLRHICRLGVRTRGFSYAVRGVTAPDVPVFVSLTSPSGDEWSWGEPSAADRVSGPAVDFCLLVTQRRHLDDLRLNITGAAAEEWMSLAQAFAGTPTLTDPNRRGVPA